MKSEIHVDAKTLHFLFQIITSPCQPSFGFLGNPFPYGALVQESDRTYKGSNALDHLTGPGTHQRKALLEEQHRQCHHRRPRCKRCQRKWQDVYLVAIRGLLLLEDLLPEQRQHAQGEIISWHGRRTCG